MAVVLKGPQTPTTIGIVLIIVSSHLPHAALGMEKFEEVIMDTEEQIADYAGRDELPVARARPRRTGLTKTRPQQNRVSAPAVHCGASVRAPDCGDGQGNSATADLLTDVEGPPLGSFLPDG